MRYFQLLQVVILALAVLIFASNTGICGDDNILWDHLYHNDPDNYDPTTEFVPGESYTFRDVDPSGKVYPTTNVNIYILVDWGSAFAGRHAHLHPDTPSAATRLSTARLALDLLEQGGGAAYLARPMVETALAEGRLHAVADAPPVELTVYAIYLAEGGKGEWIDAALARLPRP